MNKHLYLLALGAICLSVDNASAQDKTDKPATKPAAASSKDAAGLSTDSQKVGYSIGIDIANNLKKQFDGLDVDLNSLSQGLNDGLKGTKKLSEEEMKKVIEGFRKKMMEKMMADQQKTQDSRRVDGPKNLEAGKKFLVDNGKKPGVKTTASGLQYTVIKEGDGPMPKASDQVVVHYRGTLVDGKEFDSSYQRGEPATFGVGQVIKGWTEALQLMKTGAKYKLFIPSELAYGEEGAGGDIPPNSVLIFEVELIKIQKS